MPMKFKINTTPLHRFTPIDELPHPPKEWLDAITREEHTPKSCCGAKPWEGDKCICKPIERQTKCGHCKEIGHSKTTCPNLHKELKYTTLWNREKLNTNSYGRNRLFQKYKCTHCGSIGGSLYNNSNLTRHKKKHGCS